MSRNRAEVVDANLRDLLARATGSGRAHRAEVVSPSSGLTGFELLRLIEAQFQARQLDLLARRLKERDRGYYTIGSAGHEGNAAVAAALRPDDPAFLHYRSGAFFARRARQLPGQTPIFDVALSLCAAADDPIAGGRHKVFGSRDLWVPPQTSTIASHLPKAMGAAFAIDRGRYLKLGMPVPPDAIVVASFGDASLNHSTAVGAINAALWAAYQHLPMPVLWVCEDNGLGISVNTPAGWVESRYSRCREMAYLAADGSDPVETYDRACEAVRHVRRRRAPAFLHLKVARLLGHAGTDPELAYLDIERIKEAEARDPLLRSCAIAIEQGFATGEELLALYEEIGERVAAAGEEAARRPHQPDAAAIVAPLAPHRPGPVGERARESAPEATRLGHWGGQDRLPERRDPEPLGRLINHGLHDLMLQYPQMIAFGEDVARRGGVYGVTSQLWQRFGGGRVFNTLLDEQSVLGLAIGAAHLGFLPVPEIQYLAYVHNAIDQIRGEAASLQFFSEGQFRNPMVVRIASFGYQRGFGGHFHNDNAIGALREIPGVVVAAPSRGDDAVEMLRTAMAMASVDGTVVLFLEPIALYMTRDLHEPGDGEWSRRYPEPGRAAEPRRARVYGPDEAELVIVSWANGLWRSLRAARRLEDDGVRCRVVDLRWLQPFDRETLLREARAAGRVLVVDEGRRTGGLSEALLAALVEDGGRAVSARLCGEDTFIPLGPAWEQVLPSEEGIVRAARELLGGPAVPEEIA